jgi:hypothetical protein
MRKTRGGRQAEGEAHHGGWLANLHWGRRAQAELASRATTLCAPTATFGKLPLTWNAPPSSENSYVPMPPVAVTVMLPTPPTQLASAAIGLATGKALIVTLAVVVLLQPPALKE